VRRRQSQRDWMDHVEGRLRDGIGEGQVRVDIDVHLVALGLWSMMDGMIRNWMFEPASFSLLDSGARILDVYLAGLRVS